MRLFNNFSSWYFSRSALPYWCILLVDDAAIVVSGMVALYFSLGGGNIASHFWEYVLLWTCMLPLYFIGMRVFHTYSGFIRYSSFSDLVRVVGAVVIGTVLTAMVFFLIPMQITQSLPKWEIIFYTFILSLILLWTIRILIRYMYAILIREETLTKTFIYGIREGGVSIAKSLQNISPRRYTLKGFLTDEREAVGKYLMGVKVREANEDTVKMMKSEGVSALFVSPLCSDRFRENDALVNALISAGIKIMMLPSAETWDKSSHLQFNRLHEVDIEDLLPRDKIEVDMEVIRDLLHGKNILITGAAGSIGSEMVRQVAKFEPAELILVDQAETPMHDVRLKMAEKHPDIAAETIVASITNKECMEKIFSEHRPDYVFHAAAYKHVPMMEDNPGMAVQNNICGTRVIADLAVKYGTKKFVMISTDKAVNPTNVMGCSKRICEIYCQSLDRAIREENREKKILQADGTPAITQFVTTRFGNVLGSNGSVIPLFKEQIRKGGPVTVTHPEIIRFFMLIPEACQLVLEAGAMGKGGEIFVFDMGKPVRIVELAQRMIDLSGARNVEIKFTGLRDGEKLYEEVLSDAELTKPTMHPKIKVATVRESSYDLALANEEELYALSLSFDDMKIVAKMKEIVPEYKSQHSKYEILDSPL